MSRVRIGTCAGPADAALVRAMFDAHGIPIVVGAEQHAAMLGGLAGSFLSLDIFVDEADAEEAHALLRDLRAHEQAAEPAPDQDDDDEPDDERVPIEVRVDRRRRTGVVLLLACCVTFGTGHMFARAWLRGLFLAGLEVFALSRLVVAPVEGALLLAATVLTDAIGAVVRIRARPSTFPRARARRS